MILYSSHFLLLFVLLLSTSNGLSIVDEDAEEDLRPMCQRCNCDKRMVPYFVDCSKRGLTHTLDMKEIGQETVLVDLDYSNNQITELPPIPAVVNIRQLSLSGNSLSNVTADAFRELTFLAYLDLSHNSLTVDSLTRDSFRGKYNASAFEPHPLIELNLAHNHFTEIDKTTFEHLTQLQVLILDGNPLSFLDDDTSHALASLPNLRTLSLASTGLTSVPKSDLFLSWPKLNELNLADNRIKIIQEGSWSNAKSLRRLNLDRNFFRSLNKTSFAGLDNLIRLDVNNVQSMWGINEGAFSTLTSLEYLSLSNNSALFYLHPDALEGIHPEEFRLKTLLLANCRLHYLPKQLVPDFDNWKDLEVIDLQGNPWECDCHSDWLMTFLLQQIMNKTPQLTADLRCGGPTKHFREKLMSEASLEALKIPCASTDRFNPYHEDFGMPAGHTRTTSDRLALGVAIACFMAVVGAGCFVAGLFLQQQRRKRQMAYRELHNVRYQGVFRDGGGMSLSTTTIEERGGGREEEEGSHEDIVRRGAVVGGGS